MKYTMVHTIVKKMVAGSLREYVLDVFPGTDRKEFDRRLSKNYKEIVARTESIGGISYNQFEMTMIMCCLFIACIKSVDGFTPVHSRKMIDHFCNGKIMAMMYKGKSAFTKKAIQKRIDQAKKTRETPFYKNDWKTEFTYKAGAEEYFITHTECGVCKLARQEGVEAHLPSFCYMDYPSFDMQGAVLDRTKTLGAGDECCNFHVMTKAYAERIGFVKSPDAK